MTNLPTWNYRIIHHDTDSQAPWCGLHEVFYNEDGSLQMYAEEAEIVGDNRDDIVATLKEMLSDIERSPDLIESEANFDATAIEEAIKGPRLPIEDLWTSLKSDSGESQP